MQLGYIIWILNLSLCEKGRQIWHLYCNLCDYFNLSVLWSLLTLSSFFFCSPSLVQGVRIRWDSLYTLHFCAHLHYQWRLKKAGHASFWFLYARTALLWICFGLSTRKLFTWVRKKRTWKLIQTKYWMSRTGKTRNLHHLEMASLQIVFCTYFHLEAHWNTITFSLPQDTKVGHSSHFSFLWNDKAWSNYSKAKYRNNLFLYYHSCRNCSEAQNM